MMSDPVLSEGPYGNGVQVGITILNRQWIETDEKLNYHGWPTVCNMGNDHLALVCSGEREAHEDPFGRVLIYESPDGGKTWNAIPTGKESGEYTIEVFYKADENHTDFFGDTLNVIIQGVYNQTESDGDWTKGSGKTYFNNNRGVARHFSVSIRCHSAVRHGLETGSLCSDV